MMGLLLALLLLILRFPVAAQAPAWQSARAVAAMVAGTGSSSDVFATAVDAAGNVYLTGIFSGTVALDGTTLTSLGENDVFVAKFNPVSNQFVWAQRAGGTGDEEATALAVSGTNVYVVGSFQSPVASFGATVLTNTTNTGFYTDIFVAKLSDAGSTASFTWAQRAGGSNYDIANAVAVSGPNVYVTGTFTSYTADFGTATLANMGRAGFSELFVAKLSDAGSTSSFVWAQRAGGTGRDAGTVIAVNGPNVYVTGTFDSPTMSIGAFVLTKAGYDDAFVTKLTDAGSTAGFTWAQRAGGLGCDVGGYALAVSGPSVYISGQFSGSTAAFGPVSLTNANTSGYGYDVFVAKLTDAGSTGGFVWAQRAGSSDSEYTFTLAVSGANVYIAGVFTSLTVAFGTTILTNGGPIGTYDMFVAKLTDAGSTASFTWAQHAGGTGRNGGWAVAVAGSGVYVAGSINTPTVRFGTTTLTNPNANAHLSFLASLSDPTLTATTTSRTLALTQLFPNPAHGTATLRLPVGTAPAPLTLTDALGRAVRRYPVPTGPEATLDLQGLPAGFYLLRGAGPAQRLAVE
jgi:hypothetical protein